MTTIVSGAYASVTFRVIIEAPPTTEYMQSLLHMMIESGIEEHFGVPEDIVVSIGRIDIVRDS